MNFGSKNLPKNTVQKVTHPKSDAFLRISSNPKCVTFWSDSVNQVPVGQIKCIKNRSMSYRPEFQDFLLILRVRRFHRFFSFSRRAIICSRILFMSIISVLSRHRFRPLWLRSSVVSVLLSVTAGTVVTCDVYCHPDFWNWRCS